MVKVAMLLASVAVVASFSTDAAAQTCNSNCDRTRSESRRACEQKHRNEQKQCRSDADTTAANCRKVCTMEREIMEESRRKGQR